MNNSVQLVRQPRVAADPYRKKCKKGEGTLHELLCHYGIPLEIAYLPYSELPLEQFFRRLDIDPYKKMLIVREDDIAGIDPLTVARPLINPLCEGGLDFYKIRKTIQEKIDHSVRHGNIKDCVTRRLRQADLPINQPIEIKSLSSFKSLVLEACRTFFALNMGKIPWYRKGRRHLLSRSEEISIISRQPHHKIMNRTPETQLRAENLNDFGRTLLRMLGHDLFVKSITHDKYEAQADGSVLIETIFAPNSTANSEFMSTIIQFLSFLDVLNLEINNGKLDGKGFRLKIAEIIDSLIRADFADTLLCLDDRYPDITTTDSECLSTVIPNFFSQDGYKALSDISGVGTDEFARGMIMMHAWASIGPEDGKQLIKQQVTVDSFLEQTWHSNELRGGCASDIKPPRGDQFGHISWILGQFIPEVKARMLADSRSRESDPILTPQRGGGGMRYLERLLINKFGIDPVKKGPYVFQNNQFQIKSRYI